MVGDEGGITPSSGGATQWARIALVEKVRGQSYAHLPPLPSLPSPQPMGRGLCV